MCGITGLFRKPGLNLPANLLEKMTTTISHRGPDDDGIVFLGQHDNDWECCSEADPSWTVALGSRRLSILDISPAGHMPMSYQDKLWAAYNGEVYNFVELRVELEKYGHTFRSGSDTEVILAAYLQWGTECFSYFRGMWGLVLLDCARNEIILCRDRLGIKPLYLWRGQGICAVASEIKQFLHLPGFAAKMNQQVVAEYLRTGYEDAHTTFFYGVEPIPAGSWVRISLDTLLSSTPQEYWHPEQIRAAIKNLQEAGALFAEKLRECVNLYLRSDVPVGCALSGGLDSSSIAMLIDAINKGNNQPLHTFTATFPGESVDERKYADIITSHISSVPHYVMPDAATFLEELDTFLQTHDEPVGGLSIYAGYCIARLTREAGIPVILNGQGGDEILSGYWQSYFLYLSKLARNRQIPSLISHFGGALKDWGNPSLLTQVPVMLRRYFARRWPTSQIALRGPLKVHRPPLLEKVLRLTEHEWRVEEIRSMFLPRLLKWEDRNSMAFSVEGRYPFLDHELIELCLTFESRTLYQHGWTKWPLRLGLNDTLPAPVLFRRSKLGFETPQDKWLCGPLRPTLERWLKQDRPIWDYVERSGARHLADQTWKLSGKRREPGQALFRLFIFDRWMEVFKVTR